MNRSRFNLVRPFSGGVNTVCERIRRLDELYMAAVRAPVEERFKLWRRYDRLVKQPIPKRMV